MQLDGNHLCRSLTAIVPRDKLDDELSSIIDKLNFKILELRNDRKLIKLSQSISRNNAGTLII